MSRASAFFLNGGAKAEENENKKNTLIMCGKTHGNIFFRIGAVFGIAFVV